MQFILAKSCRRLGASSSYDEPGDCWINPANIAYVYINKQHQVVLRLNGTPHYLVSLGSNHADIMDQIEAVNTVKERDI